jgi:CheY-like chemotaxis protein
MTSKEIKSVLVLEDEQEALDLILNLLPQYLSAKIVPTRFPTEAIQLARNHCFDIVLLDVTLNYNGSQFGGLEVYKSLMDRYGDSSLVAYSQYITDELLQRYGLPFNFIEKQTNVVQWMAKLAADISRIRNRQSCFVAMPFGRSYEELFQIIRPCVESAGYRCVRIDQERFTESILEKIFSEIRKAKVVLFVATGGNPNVFYEAGYAIALGKEVVTVTDRFNRMPFDIRDRNAVAYGQNHTSLTEALMKVLTSLSEVSDA